MTCRDLDLIGAVRIIRRCDLSRNRIVRFWPLFVRPSMPYRWIHAAEPGGQQWLLRRNCALTPGQLAMCFAAIGVVSLLIAIAFALLGAWLVIPFAGIELLALGVAFLVHARHAGDYERIVVRADRLIVERVSGGNLAQMECQGPWIRVEYAVPVGNSSGWWPRAGRCPSGASCRMMGAVSWRASCAPRSPDGGASRQDHRTTWHDSLVTA